MSAGVQILRKSLAVTDPEMYMADLTIVTAMIEHQALAGRRSLWCFLLMAKITLMWFSTIEESFEVRKIQNQFTQYNTHGALEIN